MKVHDFRQLLEERLEAVDGLVPSPSSFKAGVAYWANGKEVLHFDADDVVDVRLTRGEISARRDSLRGDRRVHLRRSTSADWLEVHLGGIDDVEFVLHLAEVAAAAHRPAAGAMELEPPTGAALGRRRRLH